MTAAPDIVSVVLRAAWFVLLFQSAGAALFIALFGFTFFFTRAGRYLGVDALLIPRVEKLAARWPRLGRVLLWLM